MKNQLFALIGLGLLLATASAYAQTGVVKANVPFNFIVNKAELPAGQYTIQPVGSSASAMSIQSLDNQIVKAGSAACLRVTKDAGNQQAGFPPLRLPVLPGPDLDGREQPGTGTAQERPRVRSRDGLSGPECCRSRGATLDAPSGDGAPQR